MSPASSLLGRARCWSGPVRCMWHLWRWRRARAARNEFGRESERHDRLSLADANCKCMNPSAPRDADTFKPSLAAIDRGIDAFEGSLWPVQILPLRQTKLRQHNGADRCMAL